MQRLTIYSTGQAMGSWDGNVNGPDLVEENLTYTFALRPHNHTSMNLSTINTSNNLKTYMTSPFTARSFVIAKTENYLNVQLRETG